jgi:hypothetical protein
VRVLAEALVPGQRFRLHDALALDVSGALIGVGAGLAFAAP